MNKLSKSKNELVITRLIEYINSKSGVNISDKCRNSHYVFSRAVYFKIISEYVSCTLDVAASAVNRHHATAIHAKKLFEEIDSIPVYKRLYNDTCAYMKFIEETSLKEHEEIIESSNAELIEEVDKLKRIVNDQKTRLDSQQEILDEVGLEPHEVRYRKLSELKKDIFRTRVNAILKMI